MKKALTYIVAIFVGLMAGWCLRDFLKSDIILYNSDSYERVINVLIEQNKRISFIESYSAKMFPLLWNEYEVDDRWILKQYAYVFMDSTEFSKIGLRKRLLLH